MEREKQKTLQSLDTCMCANSETHIVSYLNVAFVDTKSKKESMCSLKYLG